MVWPIPLLGRRHLLLVLGYFPQLVAANFGGLSKFRTRSPGIWPRLHNPRDQRAGTPGSTLARSKPEALSPSQSSLPINGALRKAHLLSGALSSKRCCSFPSTADLARIRSANCCFELGGTMPLDGNIDGRRNGSVMPECLLGSQRPV